MSGLKLWNILDSIKIVIDQFDANDRILGSGRL